MEFRRKRATQEWPSFFCGGLLSFTTKGLSRVSSPKVPSTSGSANSPSDGSPVRLRAITLTQPASREEIATAKLSHWRMDILLPPGLFPPLDEARGPDYYHSP